MFSKHARTAMEFAGHIFILLLIPFLILCPGTSMADKDDAYEHLYEVMDRFHKSFDVYTDLSAAGNHFVVLGRLSSDGDGNRADINPGYTDNCFSGATCVENTFDSNKGNWGGWYFMNGVLEGEETQPKLNWGDYPDAGHDLTGATKLTFYAKGKTGNEQVEFFAFGIGRDPKTGNPIKPGSNFYPDSSPKVSLGYQTLTNTWQKFEIALTGVDLSYVLGGFGWVTDASHNNNQDITFYLDDIKYDKQQLDDPRFLVSYDTVPSIMNFDTVMRNVAFTYDNALALIAFLARGNPEDMRRAKLLADALVYALNNDRYFADGRLRNAYQGGDLVLFPGWKPHGKEGTVRMPGWWEAVDDKWYEDEFQVCTHTGNIAWAMLALLLYYNIAGGDQYLDAAKQLGAWVETETADTRCDGGYTGGYEGWEMTINNPAGQTKLLWKSVEHNLDLYVAFKLLFDMTGDMQWQPRALKSKNFVETMWNGSNTHFWTGTSDDGCTVNDDTIPVDIQAWVIMALDSYKTALIGAENCCFTEHHGFKGFDFNDDKDGVWFEATAQMAVAYQINRQMDKSGLYMAELRKAQKSTNNNNGKGILAACHDRVTTGFDWKYFNRLHVGATVWYIFAESKYNPYWGTATTAVPVPIWILFLLL